jgi:ParB family chromosome partitioning protein
MCPSTTTNGHKQKPLNLNHLPQATHVRWIELRLIKPSPFQAREDLGDVEMDKLVASVKKQGVLSPIKVRPLPDGAYQIVFGHRRYEAARRNKLKEILCIVEVLSDTQAAEQGLDENIERKNLTDWEEANGVINLARLYEEQTGKEMTRAELVRMRGTSRTYIDNLYDVIGLDDDLKAVAKRNRGVKTSLVLLQKNVDRLDREPFIEAIEDPKKPASVKKIEAMVETYKAEQANKRESSEPDTHTRKAISRATERQRGAEQAADEYLGKLTANFNSLRANLEHVGPNWKMKNRHMIDVIKKQAGEL